MDVDVEKMKPDGHASRSWVLAAIMAELGKKICIIERTNFPNLDTALIGTNLILWFTYSVQTLFIVISVVELSLMTILCLGKSS